MTNHWNDIDNASLVFVMGANPSENHPACMAHINAARARGAKLVVVDPRKTRTALQADDYIRIRPGADIAFINAMMNYIFGEIDKGVSGYNYAALANMVASHNGTPTTSTVARSFTNDDGTAGNVTLSKYTDSLFRVAANGDYQRASQASTTGTISNFPVRAATVTETADTVWMTLKAHVAEYDLVTAADICGCTQDDIKLAAKYFIDHSRFASTDWQAATATPQNGPTGGYRATTWLYAMGGTQHTYGSQNIRQYAVIQSLMGNMGRPGGGINALRGIHNVQGSTDMGLLFDTYPGYGTMAKSTQTWASYMNLQFGYRTVGTNAKDATDYTKLGMQQMGFYAMTQQFFAGAQNLTETVVTDEDVTLTGTASSALSKGAIKPGTLVVKNLAGTVTYVEGTDYYAAYATGSYGTDAARIQRVATGSIASGDHVLVSYTWTTKLAGSTVAGLWNYWPKNNGVDHITAFRNMRSTVADATRIKACYIIGQNPAVTEPNQSAVRDGLNDLDLLVIHEMFPTETVQCKRKSGSVTYLIPACAHVEEAGSVTNSGRWLQWRQQATQPKGNSKTDLELVLRLAKAIDDHSGFAHLPAVAAGFASKFEQLYGYYTPGWTPGSGTFNSETFAENVFKEFAAPKSEEYLITSAPLDDLRRFTINAGDSLLRGSTIWIYYAAYSNFLEHTGYNGSGFTQPWGGSNRAKNRDKTAGTANIYGKWGWAWLKNRRVFYNNGEVAGDVSDNFVSPDYLARLFINRNTAVVDYAAGGGLAYRNYKVMKDVSSLDVAHPNAATYGQFPAHSEMVESNRPDLDTTWGKNNYIDTASYDAGKWTIADGAVFHACVPSDTAVGVFGSGTGQYPLLMTSVRCVEHFQGGPITRNNSWNVEAEPVPWIEINSDDAGKYGIADGDWVNVTTARSNSTSDQIGRSNSGGTWARGFKARVGVGLQANQRVAPGVVAIPWHWGDRGLSTGSRANDLCIDAFDANTKIPEYKACLCKIEKM